MSDDQPKRAADSPIVAQIVAQIVAPAEAARPRDVDLSNWREARFSRWSFSHVRELVPTARVRAAETASAFNTGAAGGAAAPALADLVVPGADKRAVSLPAFLAATHTDAFLVLKDGSPVYAWEAPGIEAREPHLLFSVSKSITALLAGILAADGRLDPEAPVAAFVPEVAGSAYATASVRHLLDMTVSLDFVEAYLDPDSAFARYRRAMLWNPPLAGQDPGDLLAFLAALPKNVHPHGERYFYASPNSDLLGLVVERAGAMAYAALLSELLWRPMGAGDDAHVTVDRRGTARAAGGVSATAADLARIGELLRNGGRVGGQVGGSVGAREVVPAGFVADLWTGGDRGAWLKAAEPSLLMPHGRYRSQWYAVGDADDCLCAIGIHGQWIHVNRRRGTVAVKLSSQPLPIDEASDAATMAAFGAIARAL